MRQPERITEQLLDLIEQLRRAGWNIGLQQHLDAQNLLIHGCLPADAEQLGRLLAPLLCSSRSEQTEFDYYFRPWASNSFKRESELPAPPIQPLPEPSTAARASYPHVPTLGLREHINRVLVRIRDWQKPLLIVLGFIGVLGLPYQFPELKTLLLVLFLPLLLYFTLRYLGDLWSTFLTRRSSDRQQRPEKFAVAGVDDKTLFQSVGLSHSAQRLRRHVEQQSDRLDLAATVEESIRAGNWFTPVYQRLKRMPEYLVLIDRAAFSDHQSQLANALLRHLEYRELVAMDRYYFDHDPRHCYLQGHQLHGYSLAELLERHPYHRLLLFSDGGGLFDALRGTPVAWLEQLHNWGQPVLFTLATPANWRMREQTLIAQGFLLFSADEHGFAAFAALLENPMPQQDRGGSALPPLPSLLVRLPRRWLSRTAPDDNVQEELLVHLQHYLGSDGFLWLVACAVYPELHWSLTLELGKRLNIPNLTQCLGRLAPLPWFRSGYMPDWVRETLLDALGKQEKQVRTVVENILKPSSSTGLELVFVAQTTLISMDTAWRDYIFLDFMGERLSVKVPKLRRHLRKWWRQALPQMNERFNHVVGSVRERWILMTLGVVGDRIAWIRRLVSRAVSASESALHSNRKEASIAEPTQQCSSPILSENHGSGAIAQSGAVAAGAGGVGVGGNHTGAINTGWQIVNHYYTASDRHLSKAQIAQQVAGYLRWLQARTENIELRGIERAGGAPVVLLPLETAYVPLRAKWMRGDTDIALNKVLGSGNRLVIVGGPGSGKTTVLLHMAWALASSLLDGQSEPARSRLGPLMQPSEQDEQGKPKPPQECQPHELPLPLFMPLASFAHYRRHLAGNAPARERTLAHFISYHLISKQADFDLPADFFVQLFKGGQDVLLLLDGLDEVANENERAEVCQAVEDLVAGRMALRVVLTCRAIAYRSGRTVLDGAFREIAVQPLNFKQHIVPMVRQAYACIYPLDAALRTERANDLLEGIQGLEAQRRARLGRRAEAFVDSPLMVRLLLIVHFNNRRLPDDRAELFDKVINALLQVDYSPDVSVSNHLAENWKRYRDMAQQLAFHLHQQGRNQGREIEEPALKAVLHQDRAFEPYIDDFLSQARQRGSVLEKRDGAYRFIHLALQEFLVARYLREVIGAEGRAATLAFLDGRLDDPWWREPILLLVGYMAVNAAKSARDFLSALARAGSRPNAKFTAVELAGTAALEWRDSGEPARADCAWRIATLLSDSEASATSEPILRARAGDLLARLGDPRFDADHWYLPAEPLFGFIEIPAGDFKMGDDHRVSLPSYYLSRWPVTVAQYTAFVNESGFQPKDPDCLKGIANHPVVKVNWHEAMVYCRWLDERLQELACERPDTESASSESERRFWHGLADGSLGIGLPSEAEWEKAARGSNGRIYPWGDDLNLNCANYNKTGLNATSPVGCFPSGASPYDGEDLSGNVWEWTRSLFGDYPYPPEGTKRQAREDPAATGPRVLRGGSFHGDTRDARCAARDDYDPDSRYDDLGFRVVASPFFSER